MERRIAHIGCVVPGRAAPAFRCLAVTACLHLAGLAPVLAAEDGVSFFDPFDSLDLDDRWYASDGWSNGSHQSCEWRQDNLSVRDGRLVLEFGFDEEEGVTTCAELQSRALYGYGTYEASMRAVEASGTVSAFFTYIGAEAGSQHDEIDFEFLGRDPSRIQLNYYVAGKGDNEVFVPAGAGDEDGLIRLAFEWSAERIRWFVDGELVSETAPGATLPVMPSKLFFSFWSGSEQINDWLGPFDASRLPSAMEVDWVAFTAPGEACLFPQSITCQPPAE